MRARLRLRRALARHDAHVRRLGERDGHPEVRVGVKLAHALVELRLELLEKLAEQPARDGERTERRADRTHILWEQRDGVTVTHLLELQSVATRIGRNEAVLVERARLPLRGAGHRAERREDVRVVRRRAVDAGERRRHEDLVTPKNGEAAGSAPAENRGLSNDCFEDGECALLAADVDQLGQLHRRLVVVLRRRQRREARALAGGMVERD
mmetsp:Transcript_13398/g.41992  ORF Transcript_13398/g.41992 Transcript_13398/m.41992 type:complete len:211 (+) Transcript_13398:529-1161(+)